MWSSFGKVLPGLCVCDQCARTPSAGKGATVRSWSSRLAGVLPAADPLAVDQSVLRQESFFVTHLAALGDPVAEVEPLVAGAARRLDLPQYGVGSEAKGATVRSWSSRLAGVLPAADPLAVDQSVLRQESLVALSEVVVDLVAAHDEARLGLDAGAPLPRCVAGSRRDIALRRPSSRPVAGAGGVLGAGAEVRRARPVDWLELRRAVRPAHLLTNNSRFLLLPGAPRNLGSRVLALCTRRLVSDWPARFGHRLLLLETFVDPARFSTAPRTGSRSGGPAASAASAAATAIANMGGPSLCSSIPCAGTRGQRSRAPISTPACDMESPR